MPFTPIILVHVFAALGAVVIGAFVFSMKKGTSVHRLLGRVWVILMLTTALVSFGIRSNGQFSWIHILSVVALLGVSGAVIAIVRGKIRVHQRAMTAVYASLLITGAFTLLPGRRLGDLVWHAVGLV